MEKLNRRKLITQVSVGAGAVGVLAITAACDTSNTTSNTTTATVGPNDDPPAFFVTDSAKGTIKMMKGDQEVVVNDTDLAQKLLAIK